MNNTEVMSIYVVYYNTTDYPGLYVARRQRCGATDGVPFVAVDEHICARGKTLDEVRDQLPPYLFPMAPMPGDDPVVVEIWL